MISNTQIAVTSLTRGLLAVMHAARRVDVKHEKHADRVYLHSNETALSMFSLNGKRIATVSFPLDTVQPGTVVFDLATCTRIVKTFGGIKEGNIFFVPSPNNELIIMSMCGRSVLVNPIDEKFDPADVDKALNFLPASDKGCRVNTEYMSDLHKSCRALQIPTLEMSSRGPSQHVVFSHACEEYTFLYAFMAEVR